MRTTRRHPGFTLIELLVAGVIVSFVWGAVTMSLHQLSQAKGRSKLHLDASLRADSALAGLRRDLISVIRTDDLFYTRLLVIDGSEGSPLGYVDRDEILVFNKRLRPVRDRAFIGDGMEFETQYRIEEDELGSILWQRRDAVPDEYLRGGGVITPKVEGIIAFRVEAYDGNVWYDQWDSDIDGLPWALRVTVMASGHRADEFPYDAPTAILRTVIPIDRVPLPSDQTEPEDEEDPDAEGEETEAGAGAPGGAGTGGADGVGGGREGARDTPGSVGGNTRDSRRGEGGRFGRAPADN